MLLFVVVYIFNRCLSKSDINETNDVVVDKHDKHDDARRSLRRRRRNFSTRRS